MALKPVLKRLGRQQCRIECKKPGELRSYDVRYFEFGQESLGAYRAVLSGGGKKYKGADQHRNQAAVVNAVQGQGYCKKLAYIRCNARSERPAEAHAEQGPQHPPAVHRKSGQHIEHGEYAVEGDHAEQEKIEQGTGFREKAAVAHKHAVQQVLKVFPIRAGRHHIHAGKNRGDGYIHQWPGHRYHKLLERVFWHSIQAGDPANG